MREFFDEAERLDAVHESVALKERRVRSIDEGKLRAVEIRSGVTALRKRIVQFRERVSDFRGARRKLFLGVRVRGGGDRRGECRHVVGPRAVAGARQWV